MSMSGRSRQSGASGRDGAAGRWSSGRAGRAAAAPSGQRRRPERDRSGREAHPAVRPAGSSAACRRPRPGTIRAWGVEAEWRPPQVSPDLDFGPEDDDDDFGPGRADSLIDVPGGVRLQKVLAAAGIGSRRALRGDDRRGPGRGRRRDRPPVRGQGRSRAPDHPGRRAPHRGQREACLRGAEQARRGADHHVRHPGPHDHRRPARGPGRAAVPRRPARLRHRGPDAADERRRAGPPAGPPALRGAQDLPGRHARPRCRGTWAGS